MPIIVSRQRGYFSIHVAVRLLDVTSKDNSSQYGPSLDQAVTCTNTVAVSPKIRKGLEVPKNLVFTCIIPRSFSHIKVISSQGKERHGRERSHYSRGSADILPHQIILVFPIVLLEHCLHSVKRCL